jgi:uncharacterized protein (DUF2147 family)
MQRMFLAIIVAMMGFVNPTQATGGDIKGVWLTQKDEKNAKIEIGECKGDPRKLCGKIVWLEEPLRDGKPKTDLNNPASNLKERPLMGLELLKNFTKSDSTTWENGKIYNPEDGETYSCTIRLTQDDNGNEVLEVHGYVGIELLGKTQYWIRSQ